MCIRDQISSSVYVLAKIDPVALTITFRLKLNVIVSATGSIPAYPRTEVRRPTDLSTAPPSPTFRCFAHIHNICKLHMYVIQFFGVHVLIE